MAKRTSKTVSGELVEVVSLAELCRSCGVRAEWVVELVDEVGADSVVQLVVGDLNKPLDHPRIQILVDAGFADVWVAAGNAECDPATGEGCTCCTEGPDEYDGLDIAEQVMQNRIDFVMYRDGAACALAVGVATAEAGGLRLSAIITFMGRPLSRRPLQAATAVSAHARWRKVMKAHPREFPSASRSSLSSTRILEVSIPGGGTIRSRKPSGTSSGRSSRVPPIAQAAVPRITEIPTPAAKMNSESSALYTLGTGMFTMSSTFSMPFSSRLTWSDFSEEKQMAPPLP